MNFQKSILASLVSWPFLATDLSALEIVVEKNVITLSDRMSSSLTSASDDLVRFRNAVSQNPQIKTVNLQNFLGGSTTTAGLIYEVIEEKGLSTTVSGRCVSACAWIFLAGKQRSFSDRALEGRRAQVGFHKPLESYSNLRTVRGIDDWTVWAINKGTNGRFDPKLKDIYLKMETDKDMIWFRPPEEKVKVRVCKSYRKKWGCKSFDGTDALKSGVITTAKRFHIE